MSYVAIELTKEESRTWCQLVAIEPCRIGYVAPSDPRQLYVNWWFKILETDDTPDKDVKRVAIESTLINNVLTTWHRTLVKSAAKKGWTKGEKLSAYVTETETSLFNKLSATKTNQNTMIDLSTITAEELNELKKKITDREGELKKVAETRHAFEAAAKKAGYETLDAALADLGYVKESAKKAGKKSSSGRKPRVTVTPELKAAILASLSAGTMSSAEIAEKHNVGAATVAKIKKAAGLTK